MYASYIEALTDSVHSVYLGANKKPAIDTANIK